MTRRCDDTVNKGRVNSCVLKHLFFGGSSATKKMAQNPQKCAIQRATNARFSKFRRWRHKKNRSFWINELIRIDSEPKILKGCFLHWWEHDWYKLRLALHIRHATEKDTLIGPQTLKATWSYYKNFTTEKMILMRSLKRAIHALVRGQAVAFAIIIWMKIAFIITHKRNNAVVWFGTLKVQSFILTEVTDCDLLIVVTCCTFLKRKDMLQEKSS